jgi:integrase
MPTLRRRGDRWYIRESLGGREIERATGCTTRKAAEAALRRYELDRADPEGAARRRAENVTVGALIEAEAAKHDVEVTAGRMAPDTRDFYRKRLGTLLRWFGADRVAATIDAATVDAFIAARRAEGASDHTVHKELGTLRRMLDAATRAGTWCGDVRRVMPRFAPNYTPRERFLTVAEVRAILDALSPGRGAWVALAAGAGAELAALEGAQRDDFDRARRVVTIRGTKNARRHRAVPLVLPVCAELVERAFADGDGAAPLLLRPWSNNRRDLHDAARKASVEPFSLHSLRHSFATWHLAAGASFDDVARAMGHAGTAMLHRVYGHLGAEELRARLAGAIESTTPGEASRYLPGDAAHGAHRAHSAHTGELHESRRKQRVSRVPRDGIEPPTRGFSVPCSTN